MRVIASDEDVREGLNELQRLDPRLRSVADVAGPLPLRRRAADLKGIANIVVAQQVSVASAAAIFSRLEALVDLDQRLLEAAGRFGGLGDAGGEKRGQRQPG